MKRVCLLLASGLVLLAGSAVRAQEVGTMPGTLQLAPISAVAAPTYMAAPMCCPTTPTCCTTACAGRCEGQSSRFRDWLLYKPVSGRCACHCPISNCYPPTYTWFLDMCQGGGCCSHGAAVVATPCAGGACGQPVREMAYPR